MSRLVAVFTLALLVSSPAHALLVDLVDGQGSLDWETTISVASSTENTDVSHPLFTQNRHPHEGWLLYLADFGIIHEFTNFTSLGNGTSQDSLTSTFNFLGESFVLNLTYGITAVGPDGLPDLAWNGSLFRGVNPLSAFPILSVSLFNVFDYNVGDDPTMDGATISQIAGPATLIEIAGTGGISGQRGAYNPSGYTADTLGNVLTQITTSFDLNDTGAPGAYDVAGAFQWDMDLCASPTAAPECSGPGGSGGGFGGFGGFGASGGPVPEPSVALLVLLGLGLARARAS